MKIQAIVLGIGIAGLVFGAMQNGKSAAAKAVADKPEKAITQINQRFSQASPDDYIGDAACAECHSTKNHSFNGSAHAAFVSDAKLPLDKRGCEGCHGPAKAHKENPEVEVISFTKLSPKDSAAACLRCHQQTLDTSHWKNTLRQILPVLRVTRCIPIQKRHLNPDRSTVARHKTREMLCGWPNSLRSS